MKKLKLRIAKFNRILAIEQLELEGEWKNSEHVYVQGGLYLFDDHIDLRDSTAYRSFSFREFNNNEERDEYAANLINWITEEQFGGAGKLEIGKPCLVRDKEDDEWEERIYAGKVAKQLGEEKRFLARNPIFSDDFRRWKYAKPLNYAQPKIDGEIYTWEIKQ